MFATKTISAMLRQPNQWRSIALSAGLGCLALAVAYIGAVTLGKDTGIDGLNRFVEGLSGSSSSFLGNLGLWAPLGFAFAAGMASAVNPCGFAMLPAYLGLYLGSNPESEEKPHIMRQVGRAWLVGGSVTAGFVVLFGVVGGLISLGARSVVVEILPWLGFAIGVLLVFAGAWLVGGGKLYTGLAARAATRLGDPSAISPKGYFLFGLSYGTASLSCTLPVFLAVVGTSFASSSILASAGQFFLYALGMGLVIIALTLGIAFARGAMVGALRKALPYIQPIGSWLMIVAGAYIVFYWLTIGGLL
jgi:cytochrome c biogenesis protein CcdA